MVRGGVGWAVPWWCGAYARTKAFRVGCATRSRGSCRCHATRSHSTNLAPIAPQIQCLCSVQSVCLSVCLGNHFYSCALCTHLTAKYSENVFYANICTKNVQTPMLTVQVVRRCVFMVRIVYVAVVKSVY